jgi:hypothetical protein
VREPRGLRCGDQIGWVVGGRRVERHRLRGLATGATVAAPERVQRNVRGSGMEPRRRVGRVRGVSPIEGKEHVLCDILRFSLIGEHAVCDPHDARVFSPEEAVEGR